MDVREVEDFDNEVRRAGEEWGRMFEEVVRQEGKEAPEEDEGGKPKVATTTMRPSKKEVEEHMATHIPFRSWCAHCVAGKGKSNPHPREVNKDREVPEVSLDYMYMQSGRDVEQLGMPILVAKDRKSIW